MFCILPDTIGHLVMGGGVRKCTYKHKYTSFIPYLYDRSSGVLRCSTNRNTPSYRTRLGIFRRSVVTAAVQKYKWEERRYTQHVRLGYFQTQIQIYHTVASPRFSCSAYKYRHQQTDRQTDTQTILPSPAKKDVCRSFSGRDLRFFFLLATAA